MTSEISGLEMALLKQFPHGATKEEIANFLKLLKRRESYKEELLNMATALAESGLDETDDDDSDSAPDHSDSDEGASLKKTISRTLRKTPSGSGSAMTTAVLSAPPSQSGLNPGSDSIEGPAD